MKKLSGERIVSVRQDDLFLLFDNKLLLSVFPYSLVAVGKSFPCCCQNIDVSHIVHNECGQKNRL